MAQKKNNKTNVSNVNKNRQKNNLPLIITAAAVLCVAVAVIAVPKLAANKDAVSDFTSNDTAVSSNAGSVSDSDSSSSSNNTMQVVEEGGSLVIPTSEITSTATFYTVEVDGTPMEVVAVRDSSGNIRTAFNTCQICYGSGRGYYVQNGDVLVCQNCGNRFTIDQVEVQSGGCNPWPIFSDNKTETEDSIEISYDFLKESQGIFANWKMGF